MHSKLSQSYLSETKQWLFHTPTYTTALIQAVNTRFYPSAVHHSLHKRVKKGKKGGLSCSPLHCIVRAKLTLHEVPINTNYGTKRDSGILRNMLRSDIHIAHPSVSPHQTTLPCVILLICTGLKHRGVPLPVTGNPFPYSLARSKGLSQIPWKWGKSKPRNWVS